MASPPTTVVHHLGPTYSDIAKKLGVDEETVRVRIRQVQHAGTIVQWLLEVNPHVLEREATSVLLEVNDASSKQKMISQVKLVDGVVMIIDLFDRPLRVEFYHENETDRQRKLDLIKLICGDKNPTYWQRGFPPCNAKLKRTDWEILKALRKDPTQSNADIAGKLRVSLRTVKRRLSHMIEADIIYSHMLGDVKRVPGIAYSILMNCMNEKQKHEIDKMILSKLDNAVFVDTRNKHYSLYAAVFHNMGEAEETYRWIKKIDGTMNIWMNMIREIIPVRAWLDDEIDKHLAEMN